MSIHSSAIMEKKELDFRLSSNLLSSHVSIASMLKVEVYLTFEGLSLICCSRALSPPPPPIHDATCNMQLAACNRIASCVLEMLRVACSVILLQTNRIVVYSLQHVALSFKGFTGNVTTEHLSRHGDYSETQRFLQPGKCEYQNSCIFVEGGEIRRLAGAA